MTIKISEISWDNRSRKDLGDLQDLAEDIKRLGLIHPIVLDENNTLIAGARRLSALIILEIFELTEDIHFRYMDNLTALEKKEIELSENTKRKDFTWQEEIVLKQKLHILREQIAEEAGKKWTTEDSAKDWGIGERQIQEDISLAKFTKEAPELLEEKDKTTAISKMKRRKEEMRRSIEVSVGFVPENLYHGDCLEIMKTLPEHSVDLALVDTPYGVDLGETENISSAHKAFEDSKEFSMLLLKDVLTELKRVLKIGAHCYVFYAMWYHCEVAKIVGETLGGVQPNPAFWVKPNGAGNRMPFKRLTIVYEPFWFCWNFSKQRDLLERSDNVFLHNWEQDKKHPAQKPISLYKDLIKLSTHPGEIVLDPTAGSGNSLVAAIELKRKYIGIEKDKVYYDLMVQNVKGAVNGKV